MPARSGCGSRAQAGGGRRRQAVLWEARTWRGQPFLRDPVLASYLLSRLDHQDGLLAAVVMPASIHWLEGAEGPGRAGHEKLQLDCDRFFLRRGYDGRLWQPNSLDGRPLAARAIGRAVARLRNRPVAAGLVEWPRNYPWLVVRRNSLAAMGLGLKDSEIGTGRDRITGATRIRS